MIAVHEGNGHLDVVHPRSHRQPRLRSIPEKMCNAVLSATLGGRDRVDVLVHVADVEFRKTLEPTSRVKADDLGRQWTERWKRMNMVSKLLQQPLSCSGRTSQNSEGTEVLLPSPSQHLSQTARRRLLLV